MNLKPQERTGLFIILMGAVVLLMFGCEYGPSPTKDNLVKDSAEFVYKFNLTTVRKIVVDGQEYLLARGPDGVSIVKHDHVKVSDQTKTSKGRINDISWDNTSTNHWSSEVIPTADSLARYVDWRIRDSYGTVRKLKDGRTATIQINLNSKYEASTGN